MNYARRNWKVGGWIGTMPRLALFTIYSGFHARTEVSKMRKYFIDAQLPARHRRVTMRVRDTARLYMGRKLMMTHIFQFESLFEDGAVNISSISQMMMGILRLLILKFESLSPRYLLLIPFVTSAVVTRQWKWLLYSWGTAAATPRHFGTRSCLAMTFSTPTTAHWLPFDGPHDYFSLQFGFPLSPKIVICGNTTPRQYPCVEGWSIWSQTAILMLLTQDFIRHGLIKLRDDSLQAAAPHAFISFHCTHVLSASYYAKETLLAPTFTQPHGAWDEQRPKDTDDEL